MAGGRKRAPAAGRKAATPKDDPAATSPGRETRKLGRDGEGVGGAFVRQFGTTVTLGPDQGKTWRSAGERMVVGTHASCEVLLQDDTVSRFHCDLSVEGDRLLLRDLESRNGTMVDGVPVLGAYLRPGAMIAIGRTQLRVDLGPDVVRVPTSERPRFGTMVGSAPAMRRAFAVLERAAASDATVLLLGETGTGKEAAAESIHRESARRDGPFVVVDCAAIPANLLESELFGHERGAFTGATASREGAFEAASGGTVFLDEIGELGPDLQPKLLRALERREIKRIGTTQHVPVDVRLIAATHRDLRAEVNQRRFRADLYYRLAVIDVRLPALRERKEDIPLLAEHLLGALGGDGPANAALRAPELTASLVRHAWPGNVRELRNYLERCLALGAETPMVGETPSPDGPAVDLSRPLREAREEWLRPFEREYIDGLLQLHEGKITAAARAAGIDRITFYRLLWKHGLR